MCRRSQILFKVSRGIVPVAAGQCWCTWWWQCARAEWSSGAVEHGPRSRHQWRPTANGALAAGTRHCWPGGYYGATMFTDTLLPGPGHTARIFVHIKMLSSPQSERIPTVMCHPLCTMDSSLNAELSMEK